VQPSRARGERCWNEFLILRHSMALGSWPLLRSYGGTGSPPGSVGRDVERLSGSVQRGRTGSGGVSACHRETGPFRRVRGWGAEGRSGGTLALPFDLRMGSDAQKPSFFCNLCPKSV